LLWDLLLKEHSIGSEDDFPSLLHFPCGLIASDFWLFPKMKDSIRWTQYQSINLPHKTTLKCFQILSCRWQILVDTLIFMGRKMFRSEQSFVRSLFSNIIWNITDHAFGIRVSLIVKFILT
jgi:hypothetical protein